MPTYGLDTLAVLADPTRRQVFELIADRPRPVGEVARELPVSRPAVSQHLKVLKEVGLVRDHAQGSRRVYAADPDGLDELRAYLDHFWGKALASFKDVLEQTPEEKK